MVYQQKFVIPLFKINTDEKDIEAVSRVLKRGTDWTIKGEVDEFEDKLAKYTGAKYTVACNSGTSALHASLLALRIGPGDEVIVPSFSYIATANCVLMVGAKPVFADIEEDTYGLDPEDVLKKINSRTKAIIPVHVGGTPCKIEELKQISDDYGLFLIEDACEGLGATIDYKMVGTFGEIGVYSFCQNKMITTGDGGAIVTDNKEIYKELKKIVNHGREGNDFVDLGYNWRMPNILASLGISQLNKIEFNIGSRRNIAYRYDDFFGGEKDDTSRMGNIYQLYTHNFGNKRNAIKNKLTKLGIGNKVYFDPIHLTPFYRSIGYGDIKLPVTEKISKQVLSLPIFPSLTNKEQDKIIKACLPTF
jgi:perosamine synthetase